MTTTPIPSTQPKGLTTERPWPGLASYAETDKLFFYGREAEGIELHRLVRAESIAVLFGISGLGKTSLLNAGLFPRLRNVGWLPVWIRLDFVHNAVPLVAQVLNAAAHFANEAEKVVPQWHEESDTLWQAFHRRGQLFWDVAASDPVTPVLVLDQFEECFTLEQAEPIIRQRAADFLAQLSDLVENRAPWGDHPPAAEANAFTAEPVPLRVILSLREDYLGGLEGLRNLFPGLHRARFRLLPFTAVQAREVIEGPGAHLLGTGAADAILDTFLPSGADPSDTVVDPALLSLFCWQLNEQRLGERLERLEAQRIVGSRELILRNFYNNAFAGVENSEAVKRWVEESLVDAGNYRTSRSWNDARATSGVTASALGLLIERRLLHSIDRPGAPAHIELTHDRLSAVVVKSREARRLAEAKTAAKTAAERERAEAQKKLAEQRRLLWWMAVVTAIVLVVAIYAWLQKDKAERAQKAEREAKHVADGALVRATLARDEAEKLVEFMMFNLYNKLEPIGRLSLLYDVPKRVQDYYAAFAGEEETPDMLRRQGAVYERIGDILRDQGDLKEALKSQSDSFNIRQKLANQNPGDADWQRDLAASYERIGDVLRDQGDLKGALKSQSDSFNIRQKLANQDPGNTLWQRDSAASYERIGDVLRDRGDLKGALEHYRDSFNIRQRLANQKPGNADWQRDLAASYERIGDVLRGQGDLKGALKNQSDSFNIRQKLVDQDPGNADWQSDLAFSYERIGDVLSDQGDPKEALENQHHSFNIRQKLADQDPGNARWQYNLALSYERIGDVQGDLKETLESQRHSFTIRQKLVDQDPGNTRWRRDLAFSYERIGNVLRDQGDLNRALENQRQSLDIREKLVNRDLDNADWQRDLALSHERIGDVLRDQGDLKEALKSYQDALAIVQKLANQDSNDTVRQGDLAFAYWNVGELRSQVEADSKVKAREMIEKGRDILRDLRERVGLTAPQQSWLDAVEKRLESRP